MTERFMRQRSNDAVTRDALGPAATTPWIRGGDPASDDSTAWFEALSGRFESELVKAAERGQVRG